MMFSGPTERTNALPALTRQPNGAIAMATSHTKILRGPRKSLIGKKCGRWTPLKWRGDRLYWCRCDCGVERAVMANHLTNGHSQSCGCLKTERTSARNSAKLLGKKFGRLTVIKRIGSYIHGKKGYNAKWLCQCDCGQEIETISTRLLSKKTISCGCFHKERITTHGMSRTNTYRIWIKMKQRCLNPNIEPDIWANYGGRGIKICDRWLKFENFLADMGERPSKEHSIDRIDNDGHYEPGNCRWATITQQLRNTRRNRFIKINGKRMSVTEAVEYVRRMASRG
jgi:hypothetical protein